MPVTQDIDLDLWCHAKLAQLLAWPGTGASLASWAAGFLRCHCGTHAPTFQPAVRGGERAPMYSLVVHHMHSAVTPEQVQQLEDLFGGLARAAQERCMLPHLRWTLLSKVSGLSLSMSWGDQFWVSSKEEQKPA